MTTATIPKRPPPPEPTRLLMTAVMAFIKGAVISAIIVLPFLGTWPAIGTSLAFMTFCVWLAHKKGPGVGVIQRKPSAREAIDQTDDMLTEVKK